VKEREIFQAAIELTDAASAACLEKACAGNVSLQQHVEHMLEVYPQLGAFLESPTIDLTAFSFHRRPHQITGIDGANSWDVICRLPKTRPLRGEEMALAKQRFAVRSTRRPIRGRVLARILS